MMQLVWIDVPVGGFAATVNLSISSLDPNAMPTQLQASFLRYGADCGIAGSAPIAMPRVDSTRSLVSCFAAQIQFGSRFRSPPVGKSAR